MLVDLCELLQDKLELKHRVEFPESAATQGSNEPSAAS